MDVSAGTSPMNVNKQQDNALGNVNQRSESHISPMRLFDRLTQGPKETVKHTVYQTCRTTSASGKSLHCIKYMS